MSGDAGHWPILLIELLLVFGGVLAFAWWQLRDLERERRASARRRAAEAAGADPKEPAARGADATGATDAAASAAHRTDAGGRDGSP